MSCIILNISKETKDIELEKPKFEQAPSETFQSYKPILEEIGDNEYTWIIFLLAYPEIEKNFPMILLYIN